MERRLVDDLGRRAELSARRLAAGLLVTLLAIAAPPGGEAQSTCRPTRPDAEGPFYRPDAPARATTGQGLVIMGTVRSATACRPLAGARMEWWSADARGEYDDAHRASQAADAGGRYRYETDFPGRYPGRPPHLHLRVTASGHRTLITQIYPRPGQAALDVDLVLAQD